MDDETTRPTRSYLPSTMQHHNTSIFSGRVDELDSDLSVAASATPTNQLFGKRDVSLLAAKSMKGNALKSFPKNRFKNQRGTFTFNTGRGGSLGREQQQAPFNVDLMFPYADLTPIPSAGGVKSGALKSPHLEILEKHLSNDQLFQPQLLEALPRNP